LPVYGVKRLNANRKSRSDGDVLRLFAGDHPTALGAKAERRSKDSIQRNIFRT
jgi:hypothetical protein